MTSHTKSVRDFIVATFLFGDGGPLKDDTLFMGEGIIDSTGILELVEFLEDTFRIKIENEEMIPENLDSVNRVVAFVARKMGVSTAGATQSSVVSP